MSTAMNRAEREQFLAQPHVGVVSVVDRGVPLTVPVWYGYLPGGPVTVITGRRSRKVEAIRVAKWFSLCAQYEAWPYQYVTVSGPAAVTGPASYADQRAMAVRYLGQEGAEEYMASVTRIISAHSIGCVRHCNCSTSADIAAMHALSPVPGNSDAAALRRQL